MIEFKTIFSDNFYIVLYCYFILNIKYIQNKIAPSNVCLLQLTYWPAIDLHTVNIILYHLIDK